MLSTEHSHADWEPERQPLSAQIAERIIDQIRLGKYEPGTVLPSEHKLCSQYNVSRPIVREAFKLLSAQGIVETKNGKGAVVQEINDRPLRTFFRRALGTHNPNLLLDLLEVRKVLEAKSAAEAAANRSSAEVERLRVLIEEMKANLHDYDAYSRLDIEFHIRVAECSKNSFLAYLTTSIRDSLLGVINELRIKHYQSDLPEIHRFHERVFEAVENQDPVLARTEMDKHFDHVLSRIRYALASTKHNETAP